MAVEGHIVGVVASWSAAFGVIERGADHGDEVGAVELPIRVLKGVFGGIGVRQRPITTTVFVDDHRHVGVSAEWVW